MPDKKNALVIEFCFCAEKVKIFFYKRKVIQKSTVWSTEISTYLRIAGQSDRH